MPDLNIPIAFNIPALTPGEQKILELEVNGPRQINFVKLEDPSITKVENYLGARLNARINTDPPPFYLELRHVKQDAEVVIFHTTNMNPLAMFHPWWAPFFDTFIFLQGSMKLIVRLDEHALQATCPHVFHAGWNQQVEQMNYHLKRKKNP